jgi:hypothetical protein
MLRREALVRTDVSEEHSASIISVSRIGELGTTLAVASNRRKMRRNTKCRGTNYSHSVCIAVFEWLTTQLLEGKKTAL